MTLSQTTLSHFDLIDNSSYNNFVHTACTVSSMFLWRIYKWYIDIMRTSTHKRNQGEEMARTSLIYNNFIIWPPSYDLGSTWTNIPHLFTNQRKNLCHTILKSMNKYRSSCSDKFNLWPFIFWPSRWVWQQGIKTCYPRHSPSRHTYLKQSWWPSTD